MQNNCKYCGFPTQPDSYFCPNCGKELKKKPQSTTVLKQIYLYAVAIILPPLGLWPAFKYLRDTQPKAKTIGIVLIILTVISLILTWIIFQNMLSGLLGTNTQLDQLQNIGY